MRIIVPLLTSLCLASIAAYQRWLEKSSALRFRSAEVYARSVKGLAFRDGVGILTQEVQRGGFLRRQFGGHSLFCRLRRRNLNQELDIAIALEAGARRNEPSHDH